MKFSTRTLYGLKAILVLAARFGQGSVSASQIGKKENIPVEYLEQILNGLKRKGLVKSIRGPQGGYVLAKKPSETNLEILFRTLEGDAFFEFENQAAAGVLEDEVSKANLLFWRKWAQAFHESFSKITLKALLDEARRLGKSKQRPVSQNFQI
jgi:Rrf2 family protein